MSGNFYDLLGVDPSADQDTIKKAYRRRARELHPDANPGDAEAEEQFKLVSRAYEVLSDPEQRARYDRFGESGLGGASGGDPFGADPFGTGGLGDIFEAFFGGSPFGGRQQSGPPRGADSEVVAQITLEDVFEGSVATVEVDSASPCGDCDGTGAGSGTRPVTCSDCNGTGQVRRVRQSMLGQMVTSGPCTRCAGMGQVVVTPCTTCRGDGRVRDRRTHTVDVPAGIRDGQTLRLTGRGDAGPRGGPAGDLYVHIRVAPHPLFEREGDDLVALLVLSVSQAALGTHIVLPALDGDVDLVVPPGTQHGREFVARGRGLPHLQGRGRGHLRARVAVKVPVDLDEESAALLRRLAEIRGEDVAPADKGLFARIKSAFS